MSASKWVLAAVSVGDMNGRFMGKGANTLNNTEHMSINFNYQSIRDSYSAGYALYEIPSIAESQSYAITTAAACKPEDVPINFTETEYQELLNMIPEGSVSDLNSTFNNVIVTFNADGGISITLTTGATGINTDSSAISDDDQDQEQEQERKNEEALQELFDNKVITINITVVNDGSIVAKNDVPTLSASISDQSVTWGSAFSFSIASNFTDINSSDTLTYSVSGLPSWLSFNTSTGTFSGTQGVDDTTTTVSITVTADDGNGDGTASDTFDLTTTIPVATNINLGTGNDATNSFVTNVARLVIDFASPHSSDGNRFGGFMSGGFDINNDGYEDMIVSAVFPAAEPGAGYIVYGQPIKLSNNNSGATLIDIDSLNGTGAGTATVPKGFRVTADKEGSDLNEQLARYMANLGDINGDGIDDLGISDPMFTTNNAHENYGRFYVLFGQTGNFSTSINLDSALTGSNGFHITSPNIATSTGAPGFGSGVSAGDINGDGLSDMVVANPEYSSVTGRISIFYGKTSGFSHISSSSADVQIDGYATGAKLRFNTTLDFNGDGYDDVIALATQGSTNAGAYLLYGSASGISSITLATNPSSTAAIKFDNQTTTALIWPGEIGDFNGDGFEDAVWGEPGKVYIVLGKAIAEGTTVDLTSLAVGDGIVVTGDSTIGRTGFGTAGDFNGDGYDDILIADNAHNSNTGIGYVVFGSANPSNTLDLNNLTSAQGVILEGHLAGLQVGTGWNFVGDLDGDGYDDISLGGRSISDKESAYVIYGYNTADNVQEGTAGNDVGATLDDNNNSGKDILIGKSGNDTAKSEGGADSIKMGQGDDTIQINHTDFLRIDGGSGDDTVQILSGAGINLNFITATVASTTYTKNIEYTQFQDIEKIDLSQDSSVNMVTLSDVLLNKVTEGKNDLVDGTIHNFTSPASSTNTLVILGDGSDKLAIDAASGTWTFAGNAFVDTDYQLYTHNNSALLVKGIAEVTLL